MSEVASYVYLVSRGLTDDDVPEVAGQQDRPVRLVPAAGLVAVVGTVDLAEFGEEALRRNLEDLAWLERTARAHDRVVDAAARRATVAPWRLATILLDDARVAALVTQRRADLERVLDRVHGCREWSVKAYAPAGAPPDEPAGAPPDERAGAPPDERAGAPPDERAGPRPESGTDYLIRRKAETTRRTAAAAALAESAEDLHLALSAPTRASRRLPPQHRRLTGRSEEMLLNGAYLVPDGHAREFEDLVARAAADHPALLVEAAGPWPPYSFAVLPAEETS